MHGMCQRIRLHSEGQRNQADTCERQQRATEPGRGLTLDDDAGLMADMAGKSQALQAAANDADSAEDGDEQCDTAEAEGDQPDNDCAAHAADDPARADVAAHALDLGQRIGDGPGGGTEFPSRGPVATLGAAPLR